MTVAGNYVAGLGTTTRVKDQRRVSLVLAADELFSSKGFEECTTSEIATQAGVSQRTFFRYFASKEDVLLQWLDSHNLEICGHLRQRPAEELEIEALRRSLDDYCLMPKEERERLDLVNRLADTSSILRGRLLSKMAEWEERIARVLSERAGRDPDGDSRAKLLAGITISVLNTAFRETRAGGMEASVSVLIDHGFALLGLNRGDVPPDNAAETGGMCE